MQDLSQQTIKGYELLERIGAGGFGVVYRARQSTVGREVAVKIILPGFANRPDFIRRFETEAQLVARLEHPYITPLYDYWRDPSGAYLVMRFLRGGSLRDALREEAFDLESAARLLDQVTSALALAHRNDVIHRDLKPGNILLDEDGNAYLADFGIAKVLGDLQEGLTEPEAVIGSLDYISPEQARSEPVSPQTDIYSLGVVLYELLIGQHPFLQATSVERLYKHLNEPLPEITSLGENGVGDEVNTVIQKATAKNPAHRYEDVLEMAAAFRQAAGLARPEVAESVVEMLTLREQEVLRYIVEGKSNREIAQALFVTLGTVKWYINQIYRKLGVRSRVQAIVRARELDLVVPPSISDEHPPLAAEGATSISLPEPENPYQGLRPFQAADHRYFFGREKLVQKLIGRLSAKDGGLTERFLAVVGPSGAGKSSIAKAGLIPALWRGELPGSERWFVVEMLPGPHPLDELEVALLRVAADQAGNLREQLERDARGLLRVAQIILPNDDSELVIVVDQFEELFTLVEEEAPRTHFLDLLYSAVTDPRSRVRVVVTLRADFYDRPLHYPDFGELVRSRMETVLPLSAGELERAIARPAELVGVTFEEGLVATIIEDIHYQPGALPLLQYALTELFERREGRALTREAYQAMGGTVGALAKRAEETYTDLSPEGQETARQMFLRLVTLGEGIEDTRRRVARSELMAIADDKDLMEELIDTYATYRLLSLDRDPTTRTPTVEVAHEALLREWERLRSWLNESRAGVRLQRILDSAAAEWLVAERDPSFLLRGTRLDQFEAWAQETDLALTGDERAFLEASVAEREVRQTKEKARQQRELETARKLAETEKQRAEEQIHTAQRLRRRALILAGALFVAGVLAIIAFLSSQQATRNANIAQAEAKTRATAEAIAVQEQEAAEQQARIATARELASAANENLDIDPERSIWLALHAVNTTYAVDQTVLPEAATALHRAIPAVRVQLNLTGHTNSIFGLAFNPDGTRLATGSDDGTAKVWDIATLLNTGAHTGPELFTLTDHTDGVGVVSFSPDGTRLATPSYDGTVKIWDAATGQKLLTLTSTPTGTVGFFAAAFSPDGTRLATTSWDQTIRVWDISTLRQTQDDAALNADPEAPATLTFGEEQLTIIDTDEPYAVAFSPDGTRLATSNFAGTARVWDAATGQELLTLTGHTVQILGLAFSPDGTRLATGSSDSTAKVWDISILRQTLPKHPGAERSGQDDAPLGGASQRDDTDLEASAALTISQALLTLSGHTNEVLDVAFSPDGSYLATAGADAKVILWDAVSGREVSTLLGHVGWIGQVEFSPDGQHLATSGIDGTAKVWDWASPSHELSTLVGHTERVYSVVFSPDGTRLATTSLDETARVWDAATGRELITLAGGGNSSPAIWTFDITYSPDGTRLTTVSADGTAKVWDAITGQELLAPTGHTDQVLHVTFSPDGSRLATASRDGTARVWDATTGQELLNLTGHTAAVVFVTFSPDGTRLATGDENGIAKVWDVATGQELLTLIVDSDGVWVHEMTFSPDGTRLATTSLDNVSDTAGTVEVWDTVTGQELLTLSGHTDVVWDIIFSADGTRLVTAGRDTTARVWDVVTGQELLTLTGHASTISQVAFSPDGMLLATAGADATAKIWDAATGQELVTLTGHTNLLNRVAFSPNGARLATASDDGTVRVYVLPIEEVMDLARSRVTRSLTEEECRQYLHSDQCPEEP